VAVHGICLAGANFSTLLKWHLGVPLLPADCAGIPCPLCGGPVEIFGDHAVACNKSCFGDRQLGPQSILCHIFTQSRFLLDHEVGFAGNGRRHAGFPLKAWNGRRDLAVVLTIVHQNPATGRPLRGSAATFLKAKGEEKVRKNHVAGKAVLKAMFARCTASFLPGDRLAALGALRQVLSFQLGRSVARQLDALIMVSTEAPAWWAADLPTSPAITAAGNP